MQNTKRDRLSRNREERKGREVLGRDRESPLIDPEGKYVRKKKSVGYTHFRLLSKDGNKEPRKGLFVPAAGQRVDVNEDNFVH